MSENKLISPMLDNYDVGGSISEHNGVRCFPAMKKETDDRYIVKSVSIPASQTQLDALLLTGAYPDAAAALSYFKDQADITVGELETLQRLSKLEGFLPFEDWQVVPKDDGIGFEVYMISTYKRSLRKYFQRQPMTHLMAVNLGLDLCAALAVCRRCGYLYVDLKPNNVYVVNDQEFRIGDLGFIKLDSLKYATVADKYRSAYSAPEINDPFAQLNTTIDIYAAGLILYQAYNGGELPFSGDCAPNEKFAAPMYADYEMSEIILKACDPDPSARWQDPIEMGQAIVSYMQRNGANDTPIVTVIPTANADLDPGLHTDVDQLLTEDDIDLSDIDLSDIPELDSYDMDKSDQIAAESAEDVENLAFMADLASDETTPENNISDVAYEEVSDELTEMLSQADELVSHPVPESAVAPEGIDIEQIQLSLEDENEPVDDEAAADGEAVLPEEDSDSAEEAGATEAASEDDAVAAKPAFDVPAEEDVEVVAAIAETIGEEETADAQPDEQANEKPAKKSGSRVLRNIIIFLLLAIIAVAGFLYYRFIYLQPIYSIKIDGDENSMVVLVDTDTDEALLSVVCSDAHGNQLSAPVTDGVATFANLAPDTAYNVHVAVDGFHKLTGETAASYSTPAMTNIVQFSAVTGAEDGSVIVSFAVEGPDTGEWYIKYSAADEEEKTEQMLSHMITLNGLTIGKEYTFTLVPGENMYIAGNNEVRFVANTLMYAEDVNILSCVDNKLTVTWSAPAEMNVGEWTVRCYNDGTYNNIITTAETTAVFEGVDPSSAYTVEVVAAGQSVSQRAYMAANAVTVTNFQADTSNAGYMSLTWESSAAPEGGWVLLYTIEGVDTQGTVTCEDNSAVIKPMIPNANYSFTLQQANGDTVLTTPLSAETPVAKDFSGYGMTRNTMDYALCRRPSGDWSWDDVPSSDYTNYFTVGENISMVGNLHGEKAISDDIIVTLYVFRDADGNVVSFSFQERSWRNMWDQNYGEFDVPQAPAVAGEYTLSVYFNGKLATVESLTIQ